MPRVNLVWSNLSHASVGHWGGVLIYNLYVYQLKFLSSKMKFNQTLFIVIFIIVRGSQSGKVYLIDLPDGPEKLGLPLDFINSGNNFS